tara:strand:- start:3362 stop:3745 length:384 start_codon:yes stop_codon:yes gene_type:complete
MKREEEDLRSAIDLLLEADFRLKVNLAKTTLRLIMHPDGHVPDTLTRIRVLEGVSVVGQGDKVLRSTRGGNSILIVYVKFLPKDGQTNYDNIYSLCKNIKKLPGVEIVKVITVNSKRVLHNGKPIVL